MNIPNIIYGLLSTDATLTALVGNHIYPSTPDTDDVDSLPYLASQFPEKFRPTYEQMTRMSELGCLS